ncbi:hypothetical protein [Rhizobium sp. MHM7A]|uniref:hypothetical protein n=1 Tax=Rhizobium sp. MHM7A TaxID=2583233 RepID=UPI00110666F7|nr:hypothetical protein [Rhizobium sp. MHM7A]TLX16011.1 hypothetical protein FFR93_01450 [Rhizobium sp. MHM7A]
MTEQILKTSEQWQADAEHTYVVLDPDGWDRSNFEFSFYEEKITEQEFMKRLASSTLMISAKQKSMFD